ncbi:anoctamin-1-like [Rhodnius prolixus]|uniref:anoctamin-1-like n=1 Tax=Rhodnius prolixus TaxID=13249 RepID=UPI003D18C00D
MKENKKGEGVSNPGPTKEVRNKKLKNVKEPLKAKITDLKKLETYFNDGIRTVDFVLVWDSSHPSAKEPSAFEKRKNFENNLTMEGLKLENEPVESGSTLNFIKIHAPIDVLRRFAEILKLRMPMKKEEKIVLKSNAKRTLHILMERFIYTDKEIFPEKDQRFTAIYSRDKEYLFDINAPLFFTQAVRSRIVQFILDRTLFAKPTSHDMFVFGMERLLNGGIYSAAYPLHDGDLKTPGSMRYLLLHEWASVNKWHRYQPVDYIKRYFGVKIGLYFTWLGFYTHMLIPASIAGLGCFIYSFITMPDDHPSNEICSGRVDLKMCPLCDKFCGYWDLRDTCLHSKVTYLFDNYTTVFFAVFMSVWAVTFLELWKRYSAEMTHRWDLTGFDTREEQPRPQYLARLEKFKLKKRRVNVVTGVTERKVPFWTMKFPTTILSFSVVLLLILLALGCVLGVVLYRMSVLAALSVYGDSVITSYAMLFTSTTAATINLVCILGFSWVYSWIAFYLTEMEILRTQTEFDDSLTLKIYLFEFVNYYASIFYIAFYKGKLIGYPANYIRLLSYRQEECNPGGCLLELCIQLCIIMVGKQALNTSLEMIMPMLQKWWKTRSLRKHKKENLKDEKDPQWRQDYELIPWGNRDLFPEYLEMILQYGFVTIFVSAFPLAPLFALINNIIELRLDAKKILKFHRRPVAQRVRSIGVWYRILDSISKLAVVTNGFIIAFTSDFVPKLVYTLTVSENYSLDGFLNHSLSTMDTKDLDLKHRPNTTLHYCRYVDYREPPWATNRYEHTTTYWTILAARLAFVVVFENIVVFTVIMVEWCIPDVPRKLKEQIRRETFITNEIIIHEEAKRTRGYKGLPLFSSSSSLILEEQNEPPNQSISNSKNKNSAKKYSRQHDYKENPLLSSSSSITIEEQKEPPNQNNNNYNKNYSRQQDWGKYFSRRPKDEALVHRPQSFGEISEVTV